MNRPIYLPLESTGQTLSLSLSPLLTHQETGGTTIDAYKLELKSGNTWMEVHNSLDLEVNLSGLTVGSTYIFRAQAHNIHGWGNYSEVLTVISSAVPSQPLAVTNKIINLDV